MLSKNELINRNKITMTAGEKRTYVPNPYFLHLFPKAKTKK